MFIGLHDGKRGVETEREREREKWARPGEVDQVSLCLGGASVGGGGGGVDWQIVSALILNTISLHRTSQKLHSTTPLLTVHTKTICLSQRG